MVKEYKGYIESEIGLIEVVGTERGILSVGFVEGGSVGSRSLHPRVQACVKQLEQYFGGKLEEFSMELVLEGTHFQKKVWEQLTKIPFGKTVSYKYIANSIGNSNAARAVGNANGKNKIAIIVPCHRVIENNGNLGGYGGGLWRKEWLLKHERTILSSSVI